MTGQMKLQLKNLSGAYTPSRNILHDVDLQIAESQAVGIIGLNGSGKSTLARAVMNMLPIRSGEILLDGQDITKKATNELSNVGITLFMQGGRVFDELTVRENLKFVEKIPGKMVEIVDFFELTRHNEKRRADKLSGGERHRLALAMCLLREPELLILDEPSAGLDPKATDKMYEILQTLREREKLTLLLIEQNIARAVEFCDSVNLLRDGRIVQSWHDKNMNEIERTLFE